MIETRKEANWFDCLERGEVGKEKKLQPDQVDMHKEGNVYEVQVLGLEEASIPSHFPSRAPHH